MNDTPPATPKSDLSSRRIGALWIKTSMSGNKYLSGELEIRRGEGVVEKVFITVMRNTSQFKTEGSRKPDYEVFLQAPRAAKPKDDILDEAPERGHGL